MLFEPFNQISCTHELIKLLLLLKWTKIKLVRGEQVPSNSVLAEPVILPTLCSCLCHWACYVGVLWCSFFFLLGGSTLTLKSDVRVTLFPSAPAVASGEELWAAATVHQSGEFGASNFLDSQHRSGPAFAVQELSYTAHSHPQYHRSLQPQPERTKSEYL